MYPRPRPRPYNPPARRSSTLRNLFASLSLAVFAAVSVIALSVVTGAIYGLLVMLLWNAVLVYYPVLGVALPEIGFLQAWGLTILCSLLFKSSKQ